MSGLKTSLLELLDVNIKVDLDPAGNPMPPQILRAFIAMCTAYGAPLDQPKTLGKYVLPSKQVIVGNGAQTFFNQQFPQSEHFLILAIRILTGAAATVGATAWIPGIADALAINGSFNLQMNQSNVLVNMPFDAFPQSANVNDEDSGFLALEKGILWPGQTILSVPASWPTAPTTANLNMNIQLWGYKFF